MQPLELRDSWVLVTGASSGLGLELARQLARDYGAKVILTARRKDRLEALATELRLAGAEARVVSADLSDKLALTELLEVVLALNPKAAILNAGVTYYGEHLEMPEETLASLLQTNVRSVVRLSEGLLPSIAARGGGLMLVSSLAGLIPLPYQAAYSGTKAFVLNFGLGLAAELRGTGASVSVFAPGGIATEMLNTSGLSKKFGPRSPALMPADKCARLALSAFQKRKRLAVPGTLNKLNYAAARLLPTELLTSVSARLYKP